MPYKYVKAPVGYTGKLYKFGGRILEHHAVWWENTKTVFPSGYILHHKNEDTKDNRFSNLVLMTVGEHSTLHHKLHTEVDYVCASCGGSFKRTTRLAKKDAEVAYCSRACSAKGNRSLSSDGILADIKRLHLEGMSSYKIASVLKVSRNTVMKYW